MLFYNCFSLCLYKIGLPCPCEKGKPKDEGHAKLDVIRYMKRGSVRVETKKPVATPQTA